MDNYVSMGWFCFTLALINAGLAEQKNRSRAAWFLLSLLLGPIATAWIVIRRAPQPVQPSMTHRGGWKAPGSSREWRA